MKHILVTGGHGFIGRNIGEKLGGDYKLYLPASQELDLLNREAVTEYLHQNQITHVIHAAVYNQRRRDVNPEGDLSANLRMFFHLVEHAPKLEKLIYLGSGAEFDKRYPVTMAQESDFGKTIPMLNDYALSKYLMNLQARSSENLYNLRLFGVFGPYEDWRTCFISNLCCKALHNLPLTIRRECWFDFMYVDDLMEPLRWVLEGTPRFHDYNVCTGKPVLLSDIAKLVCKVAGKELPIQFLSEGMGLEYTGCPARLNEEMPFITTSLEESIVRLYHFYAENPSICDVEILRDTR